LCLSVTWVNRNFGKYSVRAVFHPCLAVRAKGCTPAYTTEAPMKTSRILGAMAVVPLVLGMATASAQNGRYGPEDEGRRFNDGSRVVCEKELGRAAGR